MLSFAQDFRIACRTLLRARSSTSLALVTLAIGISASTAVFGVIDTVLLRPLPYAEADRLVRVTADLAGAGVPDIGMSPGELDDYRASGLFTMVSGLYPANANLTGVSDPERIEGQLVSPEYFSLLGVKPALGRDFVGADTAGGLGLVVIISDSLWRRRFGGTPDVIGKVVRLDTDPVEIIGVAPPGFRHPGATISGTPEFFQPALYRGASFGTPPRFVRRIDGALGRLAPGLTIAQAESRLAAIGASMRAAHPGVYRETEAWTPRLIPLRTDLYGSSRPTVWLLVAVVAVLLLIACANVANLLLARATIRRRELAVRSALGASRARLIRQLLTENVVLSLIAAGLGILGAQWMVGGFARMIPADLAQSTTLVIDGRVLSFTILLSVMTVAIFGLWPALRSTRGVQFPALKEEARNTTAGRESGHARRMLVIAECALALALAVTAALLAQSFRALYAVDPGFHQDQLLTAQAWMPLPANASTGPFATHEKRVAYYRNAIEAVKSMPAVQSAAWASRLPLQTQRRSSNVLIQGQRPDEALNQVVEPLMASPGYFQTLGVPLRAGRWLADTDDERAAPVMMVSESFARRFFPDGSVVGAQVRPGGPTSTAPWHTIVGVVADMRSTRLDRAPHPQMYRSLWQSSDLAMSLVARMDGDPAAHARTLKTTLLAVDGEVPLFAIQPMTQVMAESVSRERFVMAVTSVFASLAMLLSALGLYSVLSYQVMQRRNEIGIRIAMGALPRDVVSMVVRDAGWLVLAGSVSGILLAVLAGYSVRSLLFAVSPLNPIAYLSIVAVMILVALMACVIPAARAAKINPLEILRR
jgi:predicted permease